MADTFNFSVPGVTADRLYQPLNIHWDKSAARYMPDGRVIDATLSRDPLNVGDETVLRPGTLLGKVSASGKYAPTIIGSLAAALGDAQTSLTVSVATATEIVRRIGTSGTFNLVGPQVANGPASGVRVIPVTFSAVNLATGVVTITATGTGAVSGVNQIQTFAVVDSTGSGTFTITVEGITTAAITYSATVATLKTNINAALDAALGTSACVASGASLAAVVLTFSGTGYAGRPVGTVTSKPLAGATGFTINGDGTVGTSTVAPVGTAGVVAVTAAGGEFVSGSIVAGNDGSQVPKGIADFFARVTNQYGQNVDAQMQSPGLLISGVIDETTIIGWPADTGLQTYIEQTWLNASYIGPGPFKFKGAF